MENMKAAMIPVTLKGVNYLLWSRMVKTALGGRGLWSHITENEAPKQLVQGDDGKEIILVDENKWMQEDMMVLSIIQNSLDTPILEAYSYCESAKALWETLQKVYGNTSNLNRIFEVKKAINNLTQGGVEFTQHLGKYRALWAELEMLRPSSVDPAILNDRREQDNVFGLLFTLDSSYNDLIKHILRSDKLPSFEEVCAQIQKEQGSLGLFGGKGDLALANKAGAIQVNNAEQPQANKVFYKHEDRRSLMCDHCKRKGHTKDKCWLIHPHLRPVDWKRPRPNNPRPWEKAQETAAFFADRVRAQEKAGPSTEGGLAAVASSSQMVKKSDIEALIQALKDSGISGHTFKASTSLKPLIVDSGASHHMISNSNLVNNIKPFLGNIEIANGDLVPIQGIGDLRVFKKNSKAFYVPSFSHNLLSVKKATTDLNCRVVFSANDVHFQDIETNKVLGRGVTKDDLYVLEDLAPNSYLSCFNSSAFSSSDGSLWHARLGHPHSRALELIFPKISFKSNECEACILGKHCKSVFPKSSTIYEKCFDLVHSDVWTSPCDSRERQKYFVTFIDEKSKYTWVTLMPSKDRVLEAFTNFQNYVTNQYNAKIKCFRSDNGGEYTSTAFKHHLSKHGILHQTSCPYTPQQNGVAERKNRHLMEVARSIMFHANVPKKFWGDALVSACYLINRIPTKILQDLSPFEVLNQTKPNLTHLRVFGCVCYVFVPGEQRNKLEPKSVKAMFIGYSTTQKGYKCYVPESRKVLVSRDVKFLEEQQFYGEKDWENLKDLSQSTSDRANNLRILMENFGISMPREQPPTPEAPPSPEAVVPATPEDTDFDHEGGNEAAEEQSIVHDQSGATDQPEPEMSEEAQPEETDVQPRRSTRIRKDPSVVHKWLNNRTYYNNNAVAHPVQAACSLAHIPSDHQAFIGAIDQGYIPRSYEEAKDHKEWREAVSAERKAMETNHTWDEADLPRDKKTVSSRWIFTIKYKSNGEIERYKARLVARGFTQTYGEDYLDTFAPVAKLHTVRVLLSLATNLEWDLWQMDVKNAFLQGELEEEVYMTPPPGLEDTVAPGKVLRLRKAIYGLKQSPRAWYHKLSITLRDRGFRKSEADHTLFTLQSQTGIIVILIYVDDIIISGNDKVGIQSTKAYLKSVFDIKDLGELKYFLGIEVCRTKEGLFLSQRKYILDLLNDAGKIDAKPAKTPLEDGYKVEREGEHGDEVFENAKLYRRMVGKLIYLTITRPDLCFAVNQASQHMQSPKVYHWSIVDRILRYLKGTHDHGIWMGCNGSSEIVGYCDADWAGDRNDRRSTTGYCTFIGGNLVTWKTKKQKVVSCSSAEAEYRAMRKLTTELTWLKSLLQDLTIDINTPITMHCDNQAAIHIASNSVFHERTKHIEVDCHKVREAVERGVILPCYTRSEDQLADIFTKAASAKVCESILPRLGLISLSSS